MLVLRRRVGERLEITTPEGRVIVVELTDAGDGWARLGVTAPREVTIMREELTYKPHDVR